MNLAAFDYDKQEWIRGPEARPLLLRQLTEELDLLLHSDGDAYARMLGVDRLEHVRKVSAEIDRLAVSP